MERKLGIVFASGAVNRICCLVVYSAAALASGYKVYIHLVNEGLVAFRKDILPRLNEAGVEATYSPPMYLPYVEAYLKNLREAVEKGGLQDLVRPHKGAEKHLIVRSLKIYACPLATQLYGIKKEDLVELVDDIRGAEYFLEEVYGGVVMYL